MAKGWGSLTLHPPCRGLKLWHPPATHPFKCRGFLSGSVSEAAPVRLSFSLAQVARAMVVVRGAGPPLESRASESRNRGGNAPTSA
jgi:hypothetical protein